MMVDASSVLSAIGANRLTIEADAEVRGPSKDGTAIICVPRLARIDLKRVAPCAPAADAGPCVVTRPATREACQGAVQWVT